MTIEERMNILEKKVEALEAAEKARADHKAASEAANPFNQSVPAWAPPIPNGIGEVPSVRDIRAEKLAYIELPSGHRLWAAIHVAANKTSYQPVVPPIFDACGRGPEEGQFSLASSPKDLPEGTVYLRKEWNTYYLSKFPPTKCHPIAGTWELEPDEE